MDGGDELWVDVPRKKAIQFSPQKRGVWVAWVGRRKSSWKRIPKKKKLRKKENQGKRMRARDLSRKLQTDHFPEKGKDGQYLERLVEKLARTAPTWGEWPKGIPRLLSGLEREQTGKVHIDLGGWGRCIARRTGSEKV